jgi:translation initiation factor 4B
MERGGSRRGGSAFEGDGKSRDFGNWERKGPLSPAPGAAPPGRDGGRVRSRDGPDERRNSPAWGEGQARGNDSQDGSRPPRREFQERPQVERAPTAAELDNQWRARMKPDAPVQSGSPTPEPSAPSSPAQASAPGSRPRLNLAKRTVSQAVESPSTATPSSDSKSSPFGAARPIDTAAREKEVEEKRQLAIREKKEADDKAREEKKAKEAAAKAAATEKSENGEDAEKEGEAPKAPFKILSRSENEEDADSEKTAVDASANGDIVDDKAVKPQELLRDPPRGPRNEGRGGGSWRGRGEGGRGRGEGRGEGRGRGDGYRGRGDRKASVPSTPVSPKVGSTAETLDEDGWSTVPAKPKPARGGRGGSRAIAS